MRLQPTILRMLASFFGQRLAQDLQRTQGWPHPPHNVRISYRWSWLAEAICLPRRRRYCSTRSATSLGSADRTPVPPMLTDWCSPPPAIARAARSGTTPLARVHGEFVLMQQLVFGISRGNVSANDNVSARRLSIPESRSAFLPSAPHDSGTRCNSL